MEGPDASLDEVKDGKGSEVDEVSQIRTELLIAKELEGRARSRVLELEKELSAVRAEVASAKAEAANAKAAAEKLEKEGAGQSARDGMVATSELVVKLQQENDGLKNQIAKMITEHSESSSGNSGSGNSGSSSSEEAFAISYAMDRDAEVKRLSTRNFELFNKLQKSVEKVADAQNESRELARLANESLVFKICTTH